MYALYGRQSRDKKDSVSIDSQFDFCAKEVPEGESFKKYKDKGYSGKNIERPDFQKLLKDIKLGKITKVIVYRLDRMSRSTLDFAQLMEYFKKYNVEFVSTTEKFDTSTPIGKAMLSIVMVFAELERSTIMQRITDNYYERGKRGMNLGGGVPFGFDLEPSKVGGMKTNIYVENGKAKIVERIFDLYANTDGSMDKVAKTLNFEGIKTAKGSDWTGIAVKRTLKNPAYVRADVDIYEYFKNQGCVIHSDIEEFSGIHGIYLFGKGNKLKSIEGFHVVIAPHEGLIDAKEWLKCQYKIIDNRTVRNKYKGKYSWLSGLTKCGKCGAAMVAVTAQLSKKYNTNGHYFACSKHRNKSTCDAKSHRMYKIEEQVEQEMFEYIKKLDNKLIIKNKRNSKKANELKGLIASKEQEIENLIDNLASAKGVAMKYINQRIDKLDEELNKLRNEYNVEAEHNIYPEQKVIDFGGLKYWGKMSIEEKKTIARSIISQININENDIEIIWKY